MNYKYLYEISYVVNSNETGYCSLGKVNIILNNKINGEDDYKRAIDIFKKSFTLKNAIENYKRKFNCLYTQTIVINHRLTSVFEENYVNSFDFNDLLEEKAIIN